MKDPTAHVADNTHLSIFTPRSQRLPSPADPRLPSVVPRTSSPFSRRRRTVSGAVSLEKADIPGTGLGHNTSGFAAPSAFPAWAARVSDQGHVGPGLGTRTGSIACASSGIALTAGPPLELQPPQEIIRRKRPSDVRTPDQFSDRPHSKRARVKPRLNQSLDGLKFDSAARQPPPSPLFFSNTQRPRPKLPQRFSSSEAAARMLSKARHEESHVKTVSLARGTVATPGPVNFFNTSTPTSASRQSLDRSSTSKSDSPGSSPGQDLNTIGIIELLECDERPTFIVDLADGRNYDTGVITPVYASSSLRSCEGLYESIVGLQSQGSPGSEAHIQFKSWLLSASVRGEGLNVCLPTCQYANILWSCSTIRKKLRVVSGSFLSTPGFQIGASSLMPLQNMGSVSTGPASAPPTGVSEQSDYFGSTAHSQEQLAAMHAPSVPISSIEGSAASADMPSALEGNTGISDQQRPIDAYPSPSKYVLDGLPLTPAPPEVTNINWFSSHIPLSHSVSPSFDWTRLPISDAMPPHIRFARSIDWASTSLGPIGTWGPDLRQMCNLIMASPHPAAMYWGDDLIAIYNEAYIMLAGQKHPTLMGQSYSVAWAEIWDDVKDVFANAKLTGEATMKDDDGLFIKRNDYLEETYFSWSIVSESDHFLVSLC